MTSSSDRIDLTDQERRVVAFFRAQSPAVRHQLERFMASLDAAGEAGSDGDSLADPTESPGS